MFGDHHHNNDNDQQQNGQPNDPGANGSPDSGSSPFSSAGDNSAPSAPFFSPVGNNDSHDSHDSAAGSDDLLGIKQQALHQLSPLVGHLDQSPEEKFRTTMMMIQASDDQSLIKEAYDAAQKISDDKARAQALLDVINEINYFTQQHHQS